MRIWTVQKKLERDDGMHYVEVCASPDGKLFRYYVNIWKAADEHELPYHPDGGYWSCSEMSGYYASLSECENAARSSLSWLDGIL